ncbi:MAG: hypothetical protein ACOC95_01595 [Planctomycetota bacterium]
MKQYIITPAMGKRLIGRALAHHPAIRAVLTHGTLAIIAGTTNGYVAEEILDELGGGEAFSRKGFRRGTVLPPAAPPGSAASEFPGDVILVDGQWRQGLTIFDVVDELRTGDIVLKGANAFHVRTRQAALYIGHPQAGTVGAVIGPVAGRRVRMIVPVGLEKRVDEPILDIVARVNAPGAHGPGMLALPGEAFCELDAITLLTGADACLLGGGGIHGAEGAVWVGIDGNDSQMDEVAALLERVNTEPMCDA